VKVPIAALLVATAARAAVVTAPGYLARTIPTPDVVQGGVVRRGEALLVGQGAFGAGAQSIVRLEAGTATVVATGFSSLAGFDLELNGNLLVVDNGGELPGATTGDTLFEIPSATTRASPVTAAGHEVLPPGTIPAAQDVLGVPETILVSDAAGPGAGRVLRVSEEGEVEVFLTGLDFLGGLAFAPGGTLFVANVDGALVGSVRLYDYFGAPRGVLAGGLSGAFAPVLDRDGRTLLLSGGVAADGSGTVVAIAPDGSVSERARGFGFTTDMFFDGTREELLVLDVGARGVTVICGDGDGDGLCDADDPCTLARPVARPRLRIGRRVAFSGRAPLEGPFDAAATGVRVLLESRAGTLFDASVPGGPSWRVRNRGRRWTYRDRRGRVSALTRIRLGVKDGTLHFRTTGRAGGPAPAPGALRVRASLVLDPPAVRRTCAVATPACAVGRGGVLRCR
jgi:hypothetical protein